ncbi:MAG: exodeoxyribonuclease III [Gammaproteobacteria bacterium RIFCSPHIGHO2_12_FULL_45_9]|nr:MAG: exodeoxyribonuclease III [Gammaproteobacteria bacterium RIFCSPHIGHO2_12_FULL_45_9]
MRIITANVNGLRSAVKKGFFEWILQVAPDVLCLQETKAQLHQGEDGDFSLPGYTAYYHDAVKRGYSGVAIYTRAVPTHVTRGLGFDLADTEGRYIQVDFPHVSIASLYLPSGSSGPERQAQKFIFLDRLEGILQKLRATHRAFVICGDWNIVHKRIDIKNFTGNQKHSGCLPEERAWLDKVFGDWGWIDGFRVVNQLPEQYTWWSNFGQAYAKNVGWRIDYQVMTPDLASHVKSALIYKEQKFSDHAPLILDYDVTL